MHVKLPGELAFIQAAALLIFIAIIGVYDLWVGNSFGWQLTVSYQIQVWSEKWPVLPLLVGLVLGHLLWPTKPGPH